MTGQMTCAVLYTVDTELSLALHQRGVSAADNLASSVMGRCDSGDYGLHFHMDCLDAAEMTGVFFVDPMPGLVYGRQIVADMIEPILARGHDVQLHVHSEWLAFIDNSPLGDLRAHNIGELPFAAQRDLLIVAREMLIEAGAPSPVAFRAGNYGANDDTLRALALLGFDWDSSFNPAYIGHGCAIGLPADSAPITAHCGIGEVAISGLFDRPGHIRPAQLCALSAWEMTSALGHAGSTNLPCFNIVSHSFELLSRDRVRPNEAVIARLQKLCAHVHNNSWLKSATFADLPPPQTDVLRSTTAKRAPANLLRTVARYGEQALAQWRYERG